LAIAYAHIDRGAGAGCEPDLFTAGHFVGALAIERASDLVVLDADPSAFVATTGRGFVARLDP